MPRNYLFPTKGAERAPEPPDPERYFRPEELDRLMAVCPIVDQRWGKLQALIILLSTTGMRIGNALKDLRWANADLESRTVFVPGTKNGEPLTATLPQRTVEALSQLPKGRLENFSLRCR